MSSPNASSPVTVIVSSPQYRFPLLCVYFVWMHVVSLHHVFAWCERKSVPLPNLGCPSTCSVELTVLKHRGKPSSAFRGKRLKVCTTMPRLACHRRFSINTGLEGSTPLSNNTNFLFYFYFLLFLLSFPQSKLSD